MNKYKVILTLFCWPLLIVTTLFGQKDSLLVEDRQIVSNITNTANLISPENFPEIKNQFKLETINNETFGAFF
jgi:hypothetical protein